ncbi:hypothetical protein ACFOHS_19880 [Jhaorihella thermophila]
MLDALGAGHGRHVFFANHQSRTLLLQGVGRTARAERDQRRAFDHLFGLPEGGWKKRTRWPAPPSCCHAPTPHPCC